MRTKQIALAYCIDNLPIAEGIENTLSPSNLSFSHHYCKKGGPNLALADQLQNHDGPIILLISDNFLKSLSCMDKALKLIQSKNNQILPVVVDGRKLDERTGKYVELPTKFQKIGDIIPYINYWQNQYLDLRGQRKSIEAEAGFDKESFGDHLRTLRQVSSEASEFLRVLRNMPHYQFNDFIDQHFEALFQFLEEEEDWEAFKAIAPNISFNKTEEKVESTPPLSIEEEIEEEPEELELDISEIPGIELLEGSENIAKIIKMKMNDPDPTPIPLPEEEEEEEESEEENITIPEDLNKEKHTDLFTEEVEEEEEDLENITIPEESDEEKHTDLFREEDEEEEEEEDIYNYLLDEDKLGGPASIQDFIEEERAQDTDPSPENFFPESTEEAIKEEEEEESEEDKIPPFEEPESNLVKADKAMDELFEEHKEEYEQEVISTIEIEEPVNMDHQYKAQELIDQAFALVNSGQTQDGIQYLHQATKSYPDDTTIRYHFALMLAQNTTDFSAAIDQLNTLLEFEPDHLEGNFLMGELSEIQDHYAEAAKYYHKVIEKDPSFQDVYARLGIVALRQESMGKAAALKHFKVALKHNPNHVDAHYQYGLLINEVKGKTKKAIKHLEKTLDLNPKHPFANYDLALLFHKRNDSHSANYYYNKAVAINPELKTEANDLAFAKSNQTSIRKKPKKAFSGKSKALTNSEIIANMAAIESSDLEGSSALEALKDNIKTLERLLSEKKESIPVKKKIDKTVFISGATSGIGKASAEIFAENGYRLILNGRRVERLEALKQQLEEDHEAEVFLSPFDVSKVEMVKEAISNIPDEWKNIDILLNNAGKAKGFVPIHEGELRHWEEMIDVNLKGLLYLTREISPMMVQQQKGHIINVCSTAGKEVYPNGNVYCATKFAVDALTKSMRLDLHKHNIRVSQVAPGHVEETEFAEVRFDGDKERAKIYEDFLPLKSRDVAETIYFLASRPSHVNIQDILMMGTQQAGNNHIHRSGRDLFEEE